jgi:signal transduction histidine kinase
LIYWLGGYHDRSIALYALLLSSFLLLGYLCYRYFSHQVFYRRLSRPLDALDESLQETGHTPLAYALNQLLETQFQHYENKIHHYQRKLESHITFINQWVHQMKTPLSVIHLTIQDEDDPLFASIQEELHRLQKGLEMVLYTSRLGHFEHDFHVESIPLFHLVKKVISENKRLFIRNQVYPEILVDEHIEVYSDEKWLPFILGQLVTNAVRYSAGSHEKVTISSYLRENRVVLEVKDRGIGIPKRDIRRVFDPFFTGQHGREYRESTGMGLYLVREGCRRLGHQVELESEAGVGTIVRLILKEGQSKKKTHTEVESE